MPVFRNVLTNSPFGRSLTFLSPRTDSRFPKDEGIVDEFAGKGRPEGDGKLVWKLSRPATGESKGTSKGFTAGRDNFLFAVAHAPNASEESPGSP